MKLTSTQKSIVTENVITELKNRFNFGDQQSTAVCELIINDVITDIEETGDWKNYLDDEVNLADIDIAVSRVLSK